MRKLLFTLFFSLLGLSNYATEWHVTTSATSGGDGTLANPWTLQTALNHPATVLPGDTIWIHAGIYLGRFKSQLTGTATNPIIVSAYPGDTVILNGNTNPSFKNAEEKKAVQEFQSLDSEIKSNLKYQSLKNPNLLFEGVAVNTIDNGVLEVYGPYTHFKNFEVTHLGNFARTHTNPNFNVLAGVEHYSGVDCKFINLVIYNNPGEGFGTWKFTAATEINGCLIYNNGWIQPMGGRNNHGPGLYVQNASDNYRIIKNNIVFNNYYKGCDIWSADLDSSNDNPNQFVKNVNATGNVMFNASSPYYVYNTEVKKDNLFIGSDDAAGVNRAKNINIIDNYFYHTTDYVNMNFEAPSLTIGWNAASPVENVVVKDNFISARNNGLRFFYAKTLNFENNIVCGRYIILNNNSSVSQDINNWIFKKNKYYTATNSPFRFPSTDLSFTTWKSTYTIDDYTGADISTQGLISTFNPTVTRIIQYQYQTNKYMVVLFNKAGANMTADFSAYSIPVGTNYKIRDAENYHTYTSGTTTGSTITFDMQDSTLEYPTDNGVNNTTAIKSATNFGVFIVEFDACQISAMPTPAISGNTYACVPSSASTTNSTTIPSGVTATWSITGGAGTISGANNGANVTINWTTLPGQITLTFRNALGCVKTVTQNIVKGCTCDIAAADYFTFTQTGNTVSNFEYHNSITGTAHYDFGEFDFGDTIPATWVTPTPTMSHSYSFNGTYTIRRRYFIKQCEVPFTETVTISSERMANPVVYPTDDIIVYPNPTSSVVNIDLTLQNDDKTKVIIRTIEGKTLITKEWDLPKGNQNIEFFLPPSIASGTYLIEIDNSGSKTIKRLIVK